ncbi:rod shape-determining protein MreC [Verrucomicrobiales bacterium]|jgi:rod shape-determining protein MreC|nr:rod shape-determining protein MreC [Verrucomicrobiales bacterium]
MSRLNIIFLIAFVGILIWITLFQPEAVSTIQRGGMVAFRPFIRASSEVEGALGSLGSEALSPAQMREKLAAVESARDRLQLEVIQLDELINENNQLRRALLYKEKSPLELIAARVINRKPSNWYNTLVIDKGNLDGVMVDSPVIVPVGEEAGLVGKITEVIGDHSAVVLLLTDEMCQVSAKLIKSQEQGIISGQRGALQTLPNLRLRYLSKEAKADAGTKVLSSGSGELFPANLYLGEIISIESGVIDSEAKVRLGVDFDSLGDVFIILPDLTDEQETETVEPEEEPAVEDAPAEAKP